MENRFSNVFFACCISWFKKNNISWANLGPSTAVQNWGCERIFLEIMTYYTGKRVMWPKVNSAMFGAEPYKFEPTYLPGEEPALHGEGEERSASPEPVRIGNTDCCVWRKCISMMYFVMLSSTFPKRARKHKSKRKSYNSSDEIIR